MAERQLPTSRLPEGGVNLFQAVKAVSTEAEARGIQLIRLSIGQPQGPALESARRAASEAVLSSAESMHEYQDNGTPGVPDFARRFVRGHLEVSLPESGVDYLPIPGIKPMLGIIPLASGAIDRTLTIATTTKPGYPTPRDWANYLKQNVVELPLNPENRFRFSPLNDIPEGTDLLMMNYPHNPTGQIATREWLIELCAYAEAKGIRLFNDAAYIALSHTPNSIPLSEVAINFPRLSWAEAFSASKTIGNGTGWRVGAIAGSPDFVKDIATIKGNTDSGLVAPMAAGALYAVENDRPGIEANRQMYARRIQVLGKILVENGMQPAVEPGAGFFTLWRTPKVAFGEEIKDAQHFNFTMIEKTGIVGVHFNPYIRYAVCADVEGVADKIDAAFKNASISY